MREQKVRTEGFLVIVSPKLKLVLKPNKTRVIGADLFNFDFDFEGIVLLDNISVLETFHFKRNVSFGEI